VRTGIYCNAARQNILTRSVYHVIRATKTPTNRRDQSILDADIGRIGFGGVGDSAIDDF
jgi:hypothetical protein